ncbi:MAG: hypothetical protein AB7P23_12605 [Amphiplicatus sp.]
MKKIISIVALGVTVLASAASAQTQAESDAIALLTTEIRALSTKIDALNTEISSLRTSNTAAAPRNRLIDSKEMAAMGVGTTCANAQACTALAGNVCTEFGYGSAARHRTVEMRAPGSGSAQSRALTRLSAVLCN